ncbi:MULTISPECIES: hypothetical protein [Cysteiniphilum]|uniref:hypothetical protein n=1 Tax=Cysteiniphilum TaxID=2056696 RepID=UPI0017845DD9|nr:MULTISPECIES: hypothetical protein [Cysteiniphilum]
MKTKLVLIGFLTLSMTTAALAVPSTVVSGASNSQQIDVIASYHMNPEIGLRLWNNGQIDSQGQITCPDYTPFVTTYNDYRLCANVTAANPEPTKLSSFLEQTVLEVYDSNPSSGKPLTTFKLTVNVSTLDGYGNVSPYHIGSFIYMPPSNKLEVGSVNQLPSDITSTALSRSFWTPNKWNASATSAQNSKGYTYKQTIAANQSGYIAFGYMAGVDNTSSGYDLADSKFKGYYRAQITLTITEEGWG